MIIGCSSKRMWVMKLFFCQNDPLMGEPFWQNKSLVSHILFELQPIIIFSPFANFGNQSLSFFFKNSRQWTPPSPIAPGLTGLGDPPLGSPFLLAEHNLDIDLFWAESVRWLSDWRSDWLLLGKTRLLSNFFSLSYFSFAGLFLNSDYLAQEKWEKWLLTLKGLKKKTGFDAIICLRKWKYSGFIVLLLYGCIYY